MIRTRILASVLPASTLWLAACGAGFDDSTPATEDRDQALAALQERTGAPVAIEVNEIGATRVVAMTPRFHATGYGADPGEAARGFLTENHALFALDAAEPADFVVNNVDVEHKLDLRHVSLQRVYQGIPVFQGSISVHMDSRNGVFRALANDFYRVSEPTNQRLLTANDAVLAARTAFGRTKLSPTEVSADATRTTFRTSDELDPTTVEQRIYQVSPGDDRFAYQVFLSWLDETRTQHMEIALIDAQDGSLLARHDLVNTFTGRVFVASPGANPQTDTRVIRSFDGNATASPSGWVDATRRTRGNNVVAATDLNANNQVGAEEIQPTANASDAFDFPFSPLQNAQNFRDASVTSAFYLANDYHDRTYALGFTETSRNFQLNNFGRGGTGNDEVQVDAQDGSGTNNANFGTPGEGSRPRMQMFIFTITGGPTEDSDFDPSVIYHEYSHGLSNRLVGNGSLGCLGGIQSGGMGEGWGDWIAASFLNDPVTGAYVTGNATTGIRDASMANSPFNYANIQSGQRTQVHDVGEIWAATLWDVRNGVGGTGGLGAAVTEQLVVTGMKMTPCLPTMLAARDGILAADQQIFAGANRCAIFRAFANRLMGDGATSTTHNSTTAIVTSNRVPADCGGGGVVVFQDDFEVDRGWVTNANNTDTATTGQWQRANPDATNSGGVKQVGTTTSGVNALVTGAAAGASAGANDIDGGVTSVTSPPIVLPTGGTLTLSAQGYLAHGSNSSSADFLRIEVVGATTSLVFQEVGAANNDNGAYIAISGNISTFAGQTVRIRISAADAAGASLVEASIDDIVIRRD